MQLARATTVVLLIALAICGSQIAAQEASTLQGAAAYWSMSDSGSDAGAKLPLQVHGNVKLGIELSGADREASLARGGDGKAAQVDGGYLTLADDKSLAINPKQWTMAIRMRDPQGVWRYPILGSDGGDKTVSMAVRAVEIASKPMQDRNYVGGTLPTIESWLAKPAGSRSVPGTSLVEAVWGAKEVDAARMNTIRRLQPKETWPNPLEQDVANAVMRVNFPVGLIGPTDWHDIVVSMTGAKLELWIDGVLVDEEYPIGETRPRTVPFLIGAGYENGQLKSGFHGLIDHVAVWNRALAPAEVVALSGSAAHVRERELAILGDESANMQYFRPRGHNRKAGDCIPYWDPQSETFRLFYLILRRNMHSKWDGGHGGLEIWQASSKDLKTWAHHPVTIPITEQWEAWNGTGAVALFQGKYHWFYPTPHYEGEHNGVQLAVSTDGVTFTKTEPHPFMPGGDVEVFQDEAGLFNLIKSGPTRQAKTKPLLNKTLVAWVRLADLEQHGGSVLTLEHADGAQFDGIVFGELGNRRWMPGSDGFKRTPPQQNAWPEETSSSDAVVQMAIVYDGAKGTIYRNGAVYAAYTMNAPLEFPSGSSLLIGLRHTLATPANSLMRGRVLDARLYDTALSAQQIAELKPDAESGPKPTAWYDFTDGSLKDRAGNFPEGMLYAGAHVENGELVLEKDGFFKAPCNLFTQVRVTSPDLVKWTEQPGTFIASDRMLAICPNVFKFGGWHYYMCGSGVWKSKSLAGPWVENVPIQLDNLAVPKTALFGKERRIYAGFLSDDGWGGNDVLRELLQDADGNLTTRFVPEMIPATGESLKVKDTIRVEAAGRRGVVDLPEIPHDYRLQMEVVPEPGAMSFGLSLCADGKSADSGCELLFHVNEKRVSFSRMSNSSGMTHGGPAIVAVNGLDKPFAVDIIVRHDVLDVEVRGTRSMVTRFWNPGADRLRFISEGGAVTFRNLRVSPLTEAYKPYPNWSRPVAEASNAGSR